MLHEHLLQHGVVFDRTVVYQCDHAALRHVGVSIDVIGFAVCGPAGMGDAEMAFDVGAGGNAFKI